MQIPINVQQQSPFENLPLAERSKVITAFLEKGIYKGEDMKRIYDEAFFSSLNENQQQRVQQTFADGGFLEDVNLDVNNMSTDDIEWNLRDDAQYHEDNINKIINYAKKNDPQGFAEAERQRMIQFYQNMLGRQPENIMEALYGQQGNEAYNQYILDQNQDSDLYI